MTVYENILGVIPQNLCIFHIDIPDIVYELHCWQELDIGCYIA